MQGHNLVTCFVPSLRTPNMLFTFMTECYASISVWVFITLPSLIRDLTINHLCTHRCIHKIRIVPPAHHFLFLYTELHQVSHSLYRRVSTALCSALLFLLPWTAENCQQTHSHNSSFSADHGWACQTAEARIPQDSSGDLPSLWKLAIYSYTLFKLCVHLGTCPLIP